jgi:hypothetical protein
MGDFFESKFIKDLMNGKLPEVEVKLSTDGIIQLAVALVMAAIIIILASRIVKAL